MCNTKKYKGLFKKNKFNKFKGENGRIKFDAGIKFVLRIVSKKSTQVFFYEKDMKKQDKEHKWAL